MLKTMIVTLLLLLATISTQAQTKSEKQVAAAVETLRKGMIDGDKAVLENITADSLSYGHSGGQIDDKKVFVEKLVTVFAKFSYNFRF